MSVDISKYVALDTSSGSEGFEVISRQVEDGDGRKVPETNSPATCTPMVPVPIQDGQLVANGVRFTFDELLNAVCNLPAREVVYELTVTNGEEDGGPCVAELKKQNEQLEHSLQECKKLLVRLCAGVDDTIKTFNVFSQDIHGHLDQVKTQDDPLDH
ncbi:hypothetical protein HDE_14356 [Halotydeus destructor]|nr:hypothetical protein HDE_14356 [Halotydeus destructor]